MKTAIECCYLHSYPDRMLQNARIHPTAVVEEAASIAPNASIWHWAHIRTGAVIGNSVSVGKGTFIDVEVKIGDYSRIQNSVNIYKGVEIGQYCFVGPAVTFTNDLRPRIGRKNWQLVPTIIEDGVSIGAGAVIKCGVTIGAFAMIAAGAVVTTNVKPFGLSKGIPAKSTQVVCACNDSVFAIAKFDGNFIRTCCQQNLNADILQIAKTHAGAV